MPKPSTVPLIYANLDQYAADPLVPVALQGTDTKILLPAVRNDNGQIPSVPPFAQHTNYVLNLETEYSVWVSEGTEEKRADKHIQETDESGDVNAMGGNFGGEDVSTVALYVEPNHTTTLPGAIFVTANTSSQDAARFQDTATGGTRRALGVRCDGSSTVAPFLVDATHDAGSGVGDRPAMEVLGNNDGTISLVQLKPIRGSGLSIRHSGTALGAPAIDVEVGDSATGIHVKQSSGNQPAARLEGFDGGANANAPLLLVPQAYDVAGSGAQSGSIWVHKFFDVVDHYAVQLYLGNSTRHVMHSRNPWCYAENMTTGDTATLTDPDSGNWTSLISTSFADDMVPHTVGPVVVTVQGELARNLVANTITSISALDLEVLDMTNDPGGADPGGLPLDKPVDLPPLDIGDANNTIFAHFTVSSYFTLLAAGKTTFTCQIKNKAGSLLGDQLLVRRVRIIVQALT